MNLTTLLERLEDMQLVHCAAEDDVAFAFKHALIQESVYSSMLLKKRRWMHRAVAEAYEQLYPDRLDEFAALLAQHYDRAGDAAKTLDYATRAGDAAARVYANAEAEANYTLAIQVARRAAPGLKTRSADLATLSRLYLKRGRVLELASRYEDALRNYQEMKRTAHERNDGSMELEALMARATLHSIVGPAYDTVRARGLSAQALVLAEELGNRQAQAKVYWNLMLLENWGGGDPRRAVDLGEKAVALAREHGLRDQLAFSLHDIAMAYALDGRMEPAWAALDEVMELWRELNNKPMIAEVLNRSATFHLLGGDLQATLTLARESLQIAVESGNLIGEGLASNLLGVASWELGEPGPAIEHSWHCVQISEQAKLAGLAFGVTGRIAWMYGTLGDIRGGTALVQNSLAQLDSISVGEDERHRNLWQSLLWAVRVRLALLQGDVALASSACRQGRLDASKGFFDARSSDAYVIYLALGELALAQGEPSRAADVAAQLQHALERSHFRFPAADALHLQAQALLAQGRVPEAIQAWEVARTAAQASGSRRLLWEVLAGLSDAERERGDFAEADLLGAQARATIEYIADHSPPALRDSFLARASVRRVIA